MQKLLVAELSNSSEHCASVINELIRLRRTHVGSPELLLTSTSR